MAVIPYLTVDEAQDYFDDRLNTEAWDDADSTKKLKALKHATSLINQLAFVGSKYEIDQPNEFPRGIDYYVPKPIQDATCELALVLLDDIDPNLEVENITATSRGYGPARTTYDRGFVLAHIRAGIPSAEAWQLLLPYLSDPLSIKILRT